MSAPSLQAIAQALGGEVRGNRACFPTPGHSKRDRGSWASLEPGAPDGVLIYCSNGGNPLEVKDILRDAGILPKLDARNDNIPWRPLTRESGPSPEHACRLNSGQRVVATFDYVDQHGQMLYRKHRIEPGPEGRSKSFAFDRPRPGGGWQLGAGEDRVPYRLPDLLAAPLDAPIFMAEGEAKADKLASWGLLATSHKDWKGFNFSGYVKGRQVFILPDNDEAGRQQAEKAQQAIDTAGGKPVILNLPGLPDGGDIVDWDGSAEDLRKLIDQTIEQDHPYTRFQETEPSEFRSSEFVIDGAIVAGAVMLFGGWGAGKTTQLVPLMFRAAHLCKPDDPLKPLLRRRVIYVTEDVEQVRQIIRSMRVAGELDGISAEEVADFFKIVSAARLKSDEIVLAAKVYEGLKTINHNPSNSREYEAQAVVVFDTRSAAIALEDENDNTEAAQVIATLRQGMPANPTIIVGHISKALKKADVADLSGRGGGAWEADAQQVLYLVNDEGERWLDVATPKHRFVATIDGIRFASCANETSATDPLGNVVRVQLIHGKPEAVAIGGRAIEKQRKKEDKEQAAANALRTRIMKQARRWRSEETGFNRQRIKVAIGGRATQIAGLISDLIDENWLLEMPIPAAQRQNNRQTNYLAVLSPNERDEYIENGTVPAFARVPPKSMVKS